jgi:transposase InsO family protein
MSIDMFRCESILLRSHWVLVVMDQFTRRIIGFGVHARDVDGVAVCRMFNTAISTKGIPKYLSSDHDPLFLYHQWQANLSILGVDPRILGPGRSNGSSEPGSLSHG